MIPPIDPASMPKITMEDASIMIKLFLKHVTEFDTQEEQDEFVKEIILKVRKHFKEPNNDNRKS